jgi:hypothetical protein
MKMIMYSIYDSVAEVFNKPFISHNDKDAMRGFRRSIEEVGEEGKSDFFLFRVGEWNDSEGKVYPLMPSKVDQGSNVELKEVGK